MLPRLVLLLVQIASAWFLGPSIKAALPGILGTQYDNLLYAVIYAVIIMIVGFAGSLVLKNVPVPSLGTFVVSLVLAGVLAVASLVPQVADPIGNALPWLRGNARLYPFVGALIGYLLKR